MTRAVIVAAGRGLRLGPHTDCGPKCLLEFGGRPLIDWQISALRAAGIDRITLVTGYQSAKLDGLGLPTRHNDRWADTNMVHSLMCARNELGSGDDVVVSYSDIICEPPVVATLLTAPGDIATVVDRNWLALWRLRSETPLSDAETLRIDEAGQIRDIGRKAVRIEDIEAQYIGLTKLTAAGAAELLSFYDSALPDISWLCGRTPETCYMTDLLRGMIENGHAVTAVPVEGGWLEFDTVADLEAYRQLVETGGLSEFFDPHRGAGPW